MNFLSDVNIVVLHGELGTGAARDTIPENSVKGIGIDYLALGHYHSYSASRLDERGVAVYSGTPEGRGFDEAFQCGVVIIDTDGRSLSHSFVPFAKRRIFDVKVDVGALRARSEYEMAVVGALTSAKECDIVRVTLTGERSTEAYADTEYLSSIFEERYFHFEIRDKSTLKIDIEAYKNDKTMVGEFIRLVSSQEGLTKQEKSDIILLGIKSLRAGRGDL